MTCVCVPVRECECVCSSVNINRQLLAGREGAQARPGPVFSPPSEIHSEIYYDEVS